MVLNANASNAKAKLILIMIGLLPRRHRASAGRESASFSFAASNISRKSCGRLSDDQCEERQSGWKAE
jgi:hypothetical protein